MRLLAFVERDRTFTEPITWVTTFVMVGIHIGAVAALFVASEFSHPYVGIATFSHR